MIVKQLQQQIIKKNKSGTIVKPHAVKSHMWVFVNCLIVNPTFDSQTKENMTLQTKNFGSTCKPSEKFFTAVCILIYIVFILNLNFGFSIACRFSNPV